MLTDSWQQGRDEALHCQGLQTAALKQTEGDMRNQQTVPPPKNLKGGGGGGAVFCATQDGISNNDRRQQL